MKIKRKNDRFFNPTRIFAIHLTIYISAVLLYWYAFVQEITYPGNASVPRFVFEQNSVYRLNFSLMWGVIILIHFAILSAHKWHKQQQIAIADREVMLDDHEISHSRLQEPDQDQTLYDTDYLDDESDDQQGHYP